MLPREGKVLGMPYCRRLPYAAIEGTVDQLKASGRAEGRVLAVRRTSCSRRLRIAGGSVLSSLIETHATRCPAIESKRRAQTPQGAGTAGREPYASEMKT